MLDARGPGIRHNFELLSAIHWLTNAPFKLQPIVFNLHIQTTKNTNTMSKNTV